MFSAGQLCQLREQFAKIDRIDPCGDAYKRLVEKLDRLQPFPLKQLADGNIKFVSLLAQNRLARKEA